MSDQLQFGFLCVLAQEHEHDNLVINGDATGLTILRDALNKALEHGAWNNAQESKVLMQGDRETFYVAIHSTDVYTELAYKDTAYYIPRDN